MTATATGPGTGPEPAPASGTAVPGTTAAPGRAVPEAGTAPRRSAVRSLLRLWPYVRPVRARFLTAAGVAIVASCMALLVPLVLKWLVDGPVADRDTRGVWLGGALLLAVGVVEALLFGLRRWLVARPLAGVEAAMRADLYARLQRLPVAFHDRWAAGQLLSRATADLQLLRLFLVFPLTFLVVNTTTILVGCVIMLVQEWTLGLVVLAPMIPLAVLCSVFEARYSVAARRAQDQIGDLTTVLEETVLGVRVVKGFGRHRSQARTFRALSEKLLATELYKARLLAGIWALIMALPELAVGAALVMGTVQVADGSLSAGTLVAFLSTALALRWPVESLGFLLAMSNEAATATDRFFEVMDAPLPADTTGAADPGAPVDTKAAAGPLDTPVSASATGAAGPGADGTASPAGPGRAASTPSPTAAAGPAGAASADDSAGTADFAGATGSAGSAGPASAAGAATPAGARSATGVGGAAGAAGATGTASAARAADAARTASASAGPAQGGLRFEGVRFRYADAPPSAPPALDGVDLRVRPGETMALVGATGSGKTTLTALVPRLHEVTAGRITLDGRDITAMPRAELRSLVAVAFEEPTLFSASVRENVLMGAEGAGERELARALRTVQADGFVAALPQGVDTQVGEQGLALSGGQRQRLALARAVVGAPRFLVLDDPLSALDVHTEAAVEAALREVLETTTALVVAHRPSTVLLADRVALLSGGRVAAVGTHQELLHRSAEYAWLMSGEERKSAAEGPPQTQQEGPEHAAHGHPAGRYEGSSR
ncbi:ABC transporter ATP-binding protein [Streptomyces sp. JJ36]|uniref:ABC transporter ATP-binding protein n=1 Tax=Streptomyces sp. JJ36 TaxID=2736645 RepID=UPI001F432879|nr:ABC transporter ATP-binding protein [Streptomyces sp. JJ36]MCF6525182.1 ABC transporter ATP-binding protein [Streptomyces sp. JJ36]